MKANNPEELLSTVYSFWDVTTEEEKEKVNAIDDKLSNRGSVGPHDIVFLKKLIASLKTRHGNKI